VNGEFLCQGTDGIDGIVALRAFTIPIHASS